MSTVESMNDTRPALEQMAERAAEQAPAWGIPRLGMTQVLLSHQDDARRRLWDSHRVDCKALGLPDPGEYKPMGNIRVAGDSTTINHNYPAPAPATSSPTTTPATTAAPIARSGLPAMLLAAAIGSGVPLAAWAYHAWSQPATPAVDTDSDTITDVRFVK